MNTAIPRTPMPHGNASWKWQELHWTCLGHWQSLPLPPNVDWMLIVSKVSATVSSCQMTSASDCSPVGILLILANPLSSSVVYNTVTEFLGFWCISIIVQSPPNPYFSLYMFAISSFPIAQVRLILKLAGLGRRED